MLQRLHLRQPVLRWVGGCVRVWGWWPLLRPDLGWPPTFNMRAGGRVTHAAVAEPYACCRSVLHCHNFFSLHLHFYALPFALAGLATSTCNTSCYNPTTQCCADLATSTVGEYFNGGCYAGPYCQLNFNSSAGIISIVGAWPVWQPG